MYKPNYPDNRKPKRTREMTFPNMARLINQKRRLVGVSQYKLNDTSNLLGKSSQAVSNIERGVCSVPIKRAKRLCEALNITKEEFIDAFLADEKLKIERGFGEIS